MQARHLEAWPYAGPFQSSMRIKQTPPNATSRLHYGYEAGAVVATTRGQSVVQAKTDILQCDGFVYANLQVV